MTFRCNVRICVVSQLIVGFTNIWLKKPRDSDVNILASHPCSSRTNRTNGKENSVVVVRLYEKIVCWKKSCYMLQTGAVGKSCNAMDGYMACHLKILILEPDTWYQVYFFKQHAKHQSQKITSKHFSNVLIHGKVETLKNLFLKLQ